jgi:glycosyltransferase involved in cell wall biosynthesis
MKKIKMAMLLKPEVGNIYSESIGGAERIFLEDLKSFRNKGLVVSAYARFSSKNYKINKTYYPLFLEKISKTLLTNKLKPLKKTGEILYFISDFLYVLFFVLRAGRQDVFLGYSLPTLALIVPSKTIILMEDYSQFHFLYFFRKIYKKSTFLFCSNHLMQKVVNGLKLEKSKNYHLLYNAVDIHMFKNMKTNHKNNKFKILYASAWNKVKGFEVFLKSLQLLRKDVLANMVVEIASDERLWYSDDTKDILYFDRIKKILKNFKNVKLLGGVSWKNMPGIYGRNDYTVFPSLWDEPFGNVVLESLACGTPVITFATGGTSEIIAKTNSVVARTKTAYGLKTAILKAYTKRKVFKKNNLLTDKNLQMTGKARLNRFLKIIKGVVNSNSKDN